MSYQQIRFGGFNLPLVVKNLLIVNGLFFLAKTLLPQWDLDTLLGLHAIESPFFRPHQFFTHMFMHVDIEHILLNMLGLWMFGSTVENVWGSKKFLLYYTITGLGAAVLHLAVKEFQIHQLMADLPPQMVSEVLREGGNLLLSNKNYIDPQLAGLNLLVNTGAMGASGALFGILLAFGMMFPNSTIYVYFAIPVKAKYLVMIYGLFELVAGFARIPGDNVAHFAHLGGMIFGYFLIRHWNKNQFRRY